MPDCTSRPLRGGAWIEIAYRQRRDRTAWFPPAQRRGFKHAGGLAYNTDLRRSFAEAWIEAIFRVPVRKSDKILSPSQKSGLKLGSNLQILSRSDNYLVNCGAFTNGRSL